MNILYCGDKGIARGVLVSILSLMMNGEKRTHEAENHTTANNRGAKNHTGGKPQYTFYIATIEYEGVEPFPEKVAEFLDGLVKKYNPENSVKLIDATKVFVENLPVRNMGSYFTPCSMLRLYVDKIPELRRLDRVLYLDYDVVCRGSIEEFYNMDIEGVEAAGMLDIYGRWFYHYHGLLRQDYMNSGVMLFNVPECLKSGVFERAVALCARRKMMLADQAALNKVIVRRKLVPRKYNEQGERPRLDTVLHHFSNNFKFWPVFHVQKVKPFEVEKVHKVLKIHEYDDIIKEYDKLKKYVED